MSLCTSTVGGEGECEHVDNAKKPGTISSSNLDRSDLGLVLLLMNKSICLLPSAPHGAMRRGDKGKGKRGERRKESARAERRWEEVHCHCATNRSSHAHSPFRTTGTNCPRLLLILTSVRPSLLAIATAASLCSRSDTLPVVPVVLTTYWTYT